MAAVGAAHGYGATQADGCGFDDGSEADLAAAVAKAKAASRVVLVLGITGGTGPAQEKEGTGGDRTTIDLPAPQHALARAVIALGKPTVIVLVNGGAVAIGPEAAAAAQPGADVGIIEALLPGPHGPRRSHRPRRFRRSHRSRRSHRA